MSGGVGGLRVHRMGGGRVGGWRIHGVGWCVVVMVLVGAWWGWWLKSS